MLTSQTQETAGNHGKEESKKDQASLLQHLMTESQNEASQGFDTKSALDIARIINPISHALEATERPQVDCITTAEPGCVKVAGIIYKATYGRAARVNGIPIAPGAAREAKTAHSSSV